MRTCLLLGLVVLGCGGSGGGGGGGSPPETWITPSIPGPADYQMAVTSVTAHAISRYIYGHNGSLAGNLTCGRAGGNRLTAFNWENNASNAGTDWFNQNDGLLGASDTPGLSPQQWVQSAHDANASLIM